MLIALGHETRTAKLSGTSLAGELGYNVGAMRYLIVVLVLSSFAFAGTAHLYNLSDGTETDLTYHGHGKGKVSGTLPSGELLSGEWVIARNGVVGWGSIYGAGYTGSTTSVAVSEKNEGTLIMRSSQGTILDCEFVAGGRHGMGACKDNHDIKYKLIF